MIIAEYKAILKDMNKSITQVSIKPRFNIKFILFLANNKALRIYQNFRKFRHNYVITHLEIDFFPEILKYSLTFSV